MLKLDWPPRIKIDQAISLGGTPWRFVTISLSSVLDPDDETAMQRGVTIDVPMSPTAGESVMEFEARACREAIEVLRGAISAILENQGTS